MTPDLLTAQGVSVMFDDQILLPPTSLSVRAGQALAIRGPNGAGKTTLLRVLSGLTSATEGTVTWRGDPLTLRKASHRSAIAGMIGSPPVASDLTVAEQLRFVRATWGDRPAEGERAAVQALEELGISHLSERYANELSSGQFQLFALAVTFARPCEVLLLDEPEQRLDSDRRDVVARAIHRRLEAGVAVVFATHSADLVSALDAESVSIGAA